jgi:peptidoglycan/LPS O-acetylase OafA/YrhL
MFGIFRTLLAINVVAFHLLDIRYIGPLAVYSFFILSGFLMTLIMQNTYGYSFKGFKRYATNRFLRLFPAYWILLTLTLGCIFFIGQDFVSSFHSRMLIPGSFSELLANVFMIFPSGTDYPSRLSPAAWALTIEMFFYILIGLGLSYNKKITVLWLVLSLSYLLFQNIYLGKLGFEYGNIYSASLPFALGAILFHFQVALTKINIPASLILILFVINIVFMGSADFFIDEHLIWKFGIVGTALNMFFSFFLISTLYDLPVSKRWKNIDKIIGELSYPIYVFHWTAAVFCSWLLFRDNLELTMIQNIAVFSTGLLLSVLIAIVVNYYLNNTINYLRAKQKRMSSEVIR